MKKIIAVIMGLCLALGLAACGQKEVQPDEAELDLDQIVASIEIKDDFKPKIGVVLGSGLGPLADEVDVVQRIDYDDIDMFPRSTVKGHKGEYVLGYLEGVPVILMNGRVHYYEGYTMEEVVTPDRIMAKLGAETVILTNSVGSLREDFKPGDLAVMKDHIAMFVPNPLIGQNNNGLGDRFTGMADAYDKELRDIAHKSAKEVDIDLKDSVFVQVTGPSFETPAESRMLRELGADTVSMSTAVETIALRHMGVKVMGINCVTNYCPNVVSESTSHKEVKEEADKVASDLIKLVKQIMKNIK